MAQQVVIAGAMFEDVPSISVPDANNVYHPFLDTTIASNAAAASDIAQGKLAYVNGSLVTGTNQGGSATLITKSITQNGTYNASSDSADGYSSVTVNVSGGGGLAYETGTWTPASDVADYTISFSSTHTTAPFFYMVVDSGTDYFTTTNTNYATAVFSPYLFCGAIQKPSSGADYYAYMHIRYRSSSTSSFSSANTASTSSAGFENWATSTGIRAYGNSASRYWRSTRTYKWIAVWAPTS